MADEKQRLVLQDLRLASSLLNLAEKQSDLSRKSAVNGALRLVISAYLNFASILLDRKQSGQQCYSLVDLRALLHKLLNSPSSVALNRESKLLNEYEYLCEQGRAQNYFLGLELSLAQTPASWKAKQAEQNNSQMIARSGVSHDHWSYVELNVFQAMLSELTAHIQSALDLADEY